MSFFRPVWEAWRSVQFVRFLQTAESDGDWQLVRLVSVLTLTKQPDSTKKTNNSYIETVHFFFCAPLRKMFEVFSPLQDGATALFLAAQEGHVSVIRHLLSSGAKVNQAREVVSSLKTSTMLYTACTLKRVWQLLEYSTCQMYLVYFL